MRSATLTTTTLALSSRPRRSPRWWCDPLDDFVANELGEWQQRWRDNFKSLVTELGCLSLSPTLFILFSLYISGPLGRSRVNMLFVNVERAVAPTLASTFVTFSDD